MACLALGALPHGPEYHAPLPSPGLFWYPFLYIFAPFCLTYWRTLPMPKPTLPLEARDQQIAALAAAGVRQGEIARRLGVHRNSVGRRLRLPTVQAHMEAMQAQVFERVWQRESERIVEQLEAGRQARQEERARKREERALRRAQGQGRTLSREDSSYDPY